MRGMLMFWGVICGVLMPVVAAGQTATLTGQVVDPQGGAVIAAVVTVTGDAGSRVKTGRSNEEGRFVLDGLVPRKYIVQIESPGFMLWRQEVDAASGAPLTATLQVAGLIEDVQVSGRVPGTLTTPTPAGSRLGLTALETPASVAVVSGDLIRELGTQTLIVAKSLAPGITSSAPMGSGGNILNVRGFTGTNSVKQLFNGMEIYNAGGVVSFPFDPWNVDHVGVLYGPASVLYGSGAIGGAVNVVARRPDPLQRRNEVMFEAGSFNTYRVAFDTTGPLSERVSYRFDLSTIDSQHWVERGDSNSVAVSGSLRFDASPNLRFTLSNDFGNQNPSKYLGTPVLNNRPVAGLERKNYNVLDADLNFTDNWTALETVWNPSPSFSVHNSTYFLYHDRIYRDVPTYSYVPATNQVRRTQFRDINNTWETQFGNTGYLKHSGTLFGLKNDVLVGLDFNRNYYHRNDNVRGGTSVVNAMEFAPGDYLDFYSEQSKPFYRIHVNQVGGFAETQLHATSDLSFVAGVRFDHYHVNRYDELVLATTESNHDASGWNVGAVYDLPRGVAVYGQYAEATDPVNSLASINANQQGFNLSPGYQTEVGLKQSIGNGRAEWTFAAYRLVKEDLLTPAVNNPSLTEQVGQQSSRGLEASLMVKAGPVRVDLNGTVLEAKFDEFKASVGGSVVSLAGNVPVNVPEESANAIVFWDVTPFLTPRVVVRYVGRRFADNTNAPVTRIPSYTVVDIGTRWRVTPKLSLDLRLDNVSDEAYADSGSSTAWLLGRPRSVAVSANILF